MNKIDIRTFKPGITQTIVIQDETKRADYNHVLTLERNTCINGPYTMITAENERVRFVLNTKEGIENTIKALQLALELEWYQK